MYDKELIREILIQISQSVETVMYRFKPVKEVKDFTDSQAGMEKLDSICMKLIAIGESLKNIDKITNGSLFAQYPEVNWKGAKAMRDIISHHYFEVDAEVIFDVCKNELPRRKRAAGYHFAPLARFAARLRSTAPFGRCIL